MGPPSIPARGVRTPRFWTVSCAVGQRFVNQRLAPDGGEMRAVEVEDSCGWLMTFGNGALGVCHAGRSKVGRAPGLEIRVYGSRGAVQAILSDDLPGSELLRVASAAEQRFEPAEVPQRLATPMPDTEVWHRRFHRSLITGISSTRSAGMSDGKSAEL